MKAALSCGECHRPYDPREARPDLEFTVLDVRDELKARLRHEDRGLKDWCVKHVLDLAEVAAFANKERAPGADLLRVLGLQPRVRYVAWRPR